MIATKDEIEHQTQKKITLPDEHKIGHATKKRGQNRPRQRLVYVKHKLQAVA